MYRYIYSCWRERSWGGKRVNEAFQCLYTEPYKFQPLSFSRNMLERLKCGE